ncbi:sensor histidine kinase [Dokdonella sp. MW10]|uniref:sensor histidine kinase n=1 Tax=Dokdonella sp. MW10 TaxID=2992926 RepID=UPI003F7DA6A7
MRWSDFTPDAESRFRVALLTVAVLASALFPYWIMQRNAQQTAEASSWVVHSSQVKETVHELMFTIRDLETLAMALYVGLPSDGAIELYRKQRTHIAPLLATLIASTRDNPDQQARSGNLEAILQGRLKLMDTAIEQFGIKNYDGVGAALTQARQLFQFRAVAEDILAAETALFADREAKAKSAERGARWATAGVLFAQLLLLGAVIFVSERQVQRRLTAETRMAQAVARSRAIVQTIREPILLLDKHLRVMTLNAAFREVYGLDEDDEGTGRALAEIGEGAWADKVLHQRLADVATRNRELWDYELGQRTVEGVERIVLVNARRMALPERDEPAVVLTVNDVTASKRAEAQIRDLNRELSGKVEQVSEVNRELESFSYSVSHDLRAPLRHIAGFADKLERHLGDAADERAHHYLGVIGDAARRMSALVEDLLLYSRLGRNAMRFQPVDMQALVDELRSLVMTDAGHRDITWTVGGLPLVMGDENMLRQVWQNLLGNAVKYTSRREHATIEVGVTQSDDEGTVFFVRDNGAGFDMDYAGKLFGVFQRLHKGTEYPGTGIGLANVRRIVARHGGRTWAEAKPDQGATFYFSLPVGGASQSPNGTTP